MASPYEATAQLLDERPELEDVLETLVALDADGPWTFDDVDCDSGAFGEIVSREFVESVDDGYRLADREATQTALQGDTPEPSSESSSAETASRTGSQSVFDGILSVTERTRGRSVFGRLRTTLGTNRTFRITVLFALGFLFLMRTVMYRVIFQRGNVVLSGNDPYHFRYWVDQLLTASPGLLEFSAMTEVLGGRATNHPFTYVVGYWFTRIIEGTPERSGLVLAFIPVFASVLVGVLVVWMALAVTEDERVAVLAVLALAVTPANALASGLGFFDHNSLDIFFLALMAATLVWLARDVDDQGVMEHLQSVRTWLVTAVFGLSCALAMVTWRGAPLLLLGLVLYAVVRPVSLVRTDDSPLLTSIPLVAGLAVATVIGHLLHTGVGWQETAVVYAPGVVLCGVVGVSLLAELVARQQGEPWWVLVGSGSVGLAGILGLRTVAPAVFSRYRDRFQDDLIGREDIAESEGLFSPEFGLGFNPVEHFGLLLLFALPALAVVTVHCVRRHERRWLVVASYGWATFGLSLVQVRFGGQFSVFASLLAGAGILWALSKVDLCRSLACFDGAERVPLRVRTGIRDVNQAVYVSFVLVVIVAVGILLTVTIYSLITIDGQQHDAAAWIAEENDDDGGFVLSHWGRNRMYNYFSWGGGDRYAVAWNDYVPFLESQNPDEWYSWFVDPRSHFNQSEGSRLRRPDGNTGGSGYRFSPDSTSVEYIVVDERRIGTSFPYDAWISAVGHFQLAYISHQGRVSVFRTVEGAMVTGEAEPGTTIQLTTDIEVNGFEYTYTREATVADNGTFSVRVAYAGTYALPDGRTVNVSSSDVTDGESVGVEGGNS